MKITLLGLIAAFKSVGGWLAAYTVSGIEAAPMQFCYSFFIFCLITVPTDLFLLNKAHENGEKKKSG